MSDSTGRKKTLTTTLQVMLTDQTAEWVRRQAQMEHMSASVWLRRLVEREKEGQDG